MNLRISTSVTDMVIMGTDVIGIIGFSHRLTAAPVALCAVVLAVVALAAPALAQTPATPVCGVTPVAGERILCSSTSAPPLDVAIDFPGVTIETTVDFEPGILLRQFHVGAGTAGALTLDIDGATITTSGEIAVGIQAERKSHGDIGLTLRDTAIDTAGAHSYGILADQLTDPHADIAGDIEIDLLGGVRIATVGDSADGVWAHGAGNDPAMRSNITVTARGDNAIETEGAGAEGILAQRINGGAGNILVDLRGLLIVTKGLNADGISSLHAGTGDIDIRLSGGGLTTQGVGATGIFISRSASGPGDVRILARNHRIVTESTEVDPSTSHTAAHGISVAHHGTGDIAIDLRGGSIETRGTFSHGVDVFHGLGEGGGDVSIRTGSSHSIATTGTNAYGIWALNSGTGAEGGAILVDVEGSVRADGAGAHGIGLGTRDAGVAVFASPLDADGYRQQTVRVNGRVQGGTGSGVGVVFSGGGRLFIGPSGRVGALSGIAVFALGDNVDDGQTVPRRLLVHLAPDGGSPADLLDGTIFNEGGETVLAVNGTPLYDSEEGGRTDRWAPNGIREVTLVEGFTGLDFSSADSFISRYAPRTAVYEALPGFLLRLDGGRPSGARIARPGSPAWARVSGGRGSYEPDRASVGAAYDFRRFSVEAGLDVALGGNVTGSFSLRHVSGTADVALPYGAGAIEAEGLGAVADLSWSGAEGYYARGRLAVTNYEIDVSSRNRGSLARDVEARGRSLGFEAGRGIALGETVTLTPRAWAARRWLSGGAFTDSVGTRVSLDEARRYTAGIGLSAETARTLEDGTLDLRASADIERALGGTDTATRVSDESLESEASATRVLLGLDATWRKGRFSLGARLAAGGPGSDDTEYSGRVSLGWTF